MDSGVDRFAALVGYDVTQRVGCEHRTRILFRPPAFPGNACELVAITDALAVEEKRAEEALDQIVGIALLLRPHDEAMAVERIGLDLDAVELEADAYRFTGVLDACVDIRGASAKLLREIGRSRQAGRRKIRIELERVPAHPNVDRRLSVCELGERAFELAFADEAPRTHEVRYDVDDDMIHLAHRYLPLTNHSLDRTAIGPPLHPTSRDIAAWREPSGTILRDPCNDSYP